MGTLTSCTIVRKKESLTALISRKWGMDIGVEEGEVKPQVMNMI